MEEYSLIKEESGEGTILGKRSRERTQARIKNIQCDE